MKVDPSWLTEPIPGNIEPTIAGWYLWDNKNDDFYDIESSKTPRYTRPKDMVWRYWNGERWYFLWNDQWEYSYFYDVDRWFGLTAKAHTKLMQG